MRTLKNQQGYLTIVTVTLVVIVGFIAVAIAYISANSASSTNNFQEANSALFIADSGLEHATYRLLESTVANRSACSGLILTNSAMGDGTYNVTSTGPYYAPAAPTTLNGALTSSATTIPVASTTNYQSAGRIMLDRELINYTAVDATDFLNATRGVDGSTASSHASGAPVGQYQCNLTSSAGAPTLSPANPGDPGGLRTLNEDVQLQEAWAVGASDGTHFSLIRWNNPTEVAWTNTAPAGTATLNGIAMLSYADGWAVGANSAQFLHWNGSSWTVVNSGLNAVAYQAVFCNASNDCFVVGGRSSNSTNIGHWNGSTWTQQSPTVNDGKINLMAINCDASNDCWAVGDGFKSTFFHWNGTNWAGVTNSLSAYTYNGVFCNSSTDCWAVGASNIFARFTGTTWGNATGALTSGIPSTQYNSIYCNNTSDCWAVGNTFSSQDVFVHWNGTAWSQNASTPSPVVNLTGVACANTNDCWAVGAASGGQGTFFHWDGSSWTNFAVSGIPNVQLNSVDVIGPGSKPWSIWSENFS